MIDLGALRAMIVDVVREELARVATPDEYFTVGEAAEVAKVTTKTIRRWIAEGMPAHRAGRHLRVTRVDLEARMRGGRRERDLSPEAWADHLLTNGSQ